MRVSAALMLEFADDTHWRIQEFTLGGPNTRCPLIKILRAIARIEGEARVEVFFYDARVY